MTTHAYFWVNLVLCVGLYGGDLRWDWSVRDHIPLDHLIVQSHRGGGELMPENSLETFQYAWGLGTVPEADVRTTRDGVLVPFHDNDFRRVLPNASAEKQKQWVKDVSWAELSHIDVGAWRGVKFAGQNVPRLSHVFRVMAQDRKRRMYIDIKDVDLAQLASEAQNAGVSRQLIVASTDYSVLRRWKELAPDSSTLLWMGGTEEALTKRLDGLEFMPPRVRSIRRRILSSHTCASGSRLCAPSRFSERLRFAGNSKRQDSRSPGPHQER